MTPDITVRGLVPTDMEWAAHLRILRRIEERGSVQSLEVTTMSHVEQDVWIELKRQGLLEEYQDGFWTRSRLSRYGHVYLKERAAA